MKKKSLLFSFSLLIGGGLSAQTIDFAEDMTVPFDSVSFGSVVFIDVEGDGDLDVLLSGYDPSTAKVAKLYTNDGSGNFSLVSGTAFEPNDNGSIAVADIDGDNDMDVLITGAGASQNIAKLYTNDGAGVFTEVAGTPFDGVSNSSIAFADVDGDGDQDVLITGNNNTSQKIAKLYTNDGSGVFTLVAGTPFEGVWLGSLVFGDLDGDNDQDVIITGLNGASLASSKLYLNDGSGVFALTSSTFMSVQRGFVAVSDIDGDNDLDVVMSGYTNGSQRTITMYTNDGSAAFTVAASPFIGNQNGSIAFSDVDLDGDNDVLITGFDAGANRLAKLYENDATGIFTEVMGMPFDGVISSYVAFADVNGDGKDDLITTGQAVAATVTKLYLNTTCMLDLNTTLSGLTITSDATGATYKWLDCDNNNAMIVGETGQSYTATVNGNYSVEVTEGVCVDTSLCVSIATVSIIENVGGSSVNVFPNPSSGKFTISSEVMNNSTISVYNAEGKVVLENVKLTKLEQTIDLGNVRKGVYILKIKNDTKSETIRIIVE